MTARPDHGDRKASAATLGCRGRQVRPEPMVPSLARRELQARRVTRASAAFREQPAYVAPLEIMAQRATKETRERRVIREI